MFSFWIKTGTRLSVGGDLSKSLIANSFVISPPTCCTSSTVQHAEDQDRWNPEKDGWTSGSTKSPLISLSSLFFLFTWWFAQLYPQTPSLLSLNKFMLITKFKLNESCQFTMCTPCTSMNKLAYSLFLAFFLVLVNIYLHRDPCCLSNWLMWYDWMNGTMLFFAKYLGFLLKKIINSLSPQIYENSNQGQS